MINYLLFSLLIITACMLDNSSGHQNKKSADLDPGKKVYNRYCLACHQTDGSGVPGLYPPLQQTDMVLYQKEELIKVILNGMQGPVEVKGEIYNNIMPPHDYLTNEQIADVLSYIRQSFGNDAGSVTAEEVEMLRK